MALHAAELPLPVAAATTLSASPPRARLALRVMPAHKPHHKLVRVAPLSTSRHPPASALSSASSTATALSVAVVNTPSATTSCAFVALVVPLRLPSLASALSPASASPPTHAKARQRSASPLNAQLHRRAGRRVLVRHLAPASASAWMGAYARPRLVSSPNRHPATANNTTTTIIRVDDPWAPTPATPLSVASAPLSSDYDSVKSPASITSTTSAISATSATSATPVAPAAVPVPVTSISLSTSLSSSAGGTETNADTDRELDNESQSEDVEVALTLDTATESATESTIESATGFATPPPDGGNGLGSDPRVIAAGMFFFLLVGGGTFAAMTGAIGTDSFVRLAAWFETLGPNAVVLYAVLYFLLELLAVPALPLTLGSGYLFGVLRGTIAVSIASSLAAGAAFLIARYGLRDVVARIAERYPRFRAMDRAIGREGFKFVFLLRLSPLLPFSISNYLYGLTSVDFTQFFLASWSGMLPGTIAYVSAGAAVGALSELGDGASSKMNPYLVVLGLVGTVGALWMFARMASRAIRGAVEEDADEERRLRAH